MKRNGQTNQLGPALKKRPSSSSTLEHIKLADFKEVLGSNYVKHLHYKFENKILKDTQQGGKGEANPYNDQAMGFKKWWGKDLGRDGGGGMPGTADMNSKLILAYIFRKCCGQNDPNKYHWSFTDIGCAEVSQQESHSVINIYSEINLYNK